MQNKILYAGCAIISPDDRILVTSQENNTIDLYGNMSISIETHVPQGNSARDEIEEEISIILGNDVVNKLKFMNSFMTSVLVRNIMNRSLQVFVCKLRKMCTFNVFDPTQYQFAFMPLEVVHKRALSNDIKLTANSLSILNHLARNRLKYGDAL